MKRIIAFVLLAVMLVGLTACGTVNDTDVAILWTDKGTAELPNSLINAMERAMYIENITYKHYGAEGDSAKQLTQAQEAVNGGCAALLVELVDPADAQQYVDLAKGKDIPVVFFGCDVAPEVVSSYAKCAHVSTDEATLLSTYATMVDAHVTENLEALDQNGDGKITYVNLDGTAVELTNTALVEVNATLDELTVKTETKESGFLFFKSTTDYGRLTTADGTVVELILSGSDEQTLNYLVKLQELGFNADKLSTHFVPVFTVGADADYKAYVLAGKPADEAAVEEYYKQMRNLVDLTTVEEEDLEAMVYNTMNIIDDGRITNTVIENYDEVAVQVASITASLLTGKTVEKLTVTVPYTVYAE